MLPQMPSVCFLIKLRSQNGSYDFVGLMTVENEKKIYIYTDFEGIKGWEPER